MKSIFEALAGFFSDINNYLNLIPILVILFLKSKLDLNLGKYWVKSFYWTSLRGFFRVKNNKISGVYKQHWYMEANQHYPNATDRQSLIVLKQFNNYCYGEFTAKAGREKYYIFGEMIDRKIIGHWRDIESPLGYFGSFELTIVSNKKIKGFWIGHSNENPNKINFHPWTFTAVTNTAKPLFWILR